MRDQAQLEGVFTFDHCTRWPRMIPHPTASHRIPVSGSNQSVDPRAMTDSDWEPLADALNRFVAISGVDEQQAKGDICQAIGIVDLGIDVRLRIDRADPELGGQRFSGHTVDVPGHLEPDDLDWVASRPTKSWDIDSSGGWDLRPIDLIELKIGDVKARANSLAIALAASSGDERLKIVNSRRSSRWRDLVRRGRPKVLRRCLEPATAQWRSARPLADRCPPAQARGQRVCPVIGPYQCATMSRGSQQ